MNQFSVITMAVRLFAVIATGTVFFRLVEGWTWVDSYFFTVVTISTVGYGDPIPVTDLGKIGATILIFAGLGVFALFIQQVAAQHLVQMDAHPGWFQRWVMRVNRARHDRRTQHTGQPPAEGPANDTPSGETKGKGPSSPT